MTNFVVRQLGSVVYFTVIVPLHRKPKVEPIANEPYKFNDLINVVGTIAPFVIILSRSQLISRPFYSFSNGLSALLRVEVGHDAARWMGTACPVHIE